MTTDLVGCRPRSGFWRRAWTKLMLGMCTAVLLAGCGDITAPKLVELARNRALWESQRLHFYFFHQTDGCFCQYSGQTVAIRVDADTVTSATLVATGEQLSNRGWLTIPKLFDYAQGLLEDKNLRVELRYDPNMGHPTLIDFSCPPNTLDCGRSTRILLVPVLL
jgi:hypothetical protein